MARALTALSGFFIMFFYHSIQSQDINNNFCVEQPWAWSSTLNSEGNEGNSFMTTDAAGNLFVAGNFEFGLTPADSTYKSKGSQDFYIIKYDQGGGILWEKIVGSAGLDNITSMSADGEGNLYATGSFSDTLEISGEEFINHEQSTDIFLLKLDPSGEFEWLQQYGGTGYDYAYNVIVDKENRIYMTGQFEGSADIGGLTIDSDAGGKDFLVKVNSAGDNIWLKQYGNTTGSGVEVGVKSNNNIVIGGTYSDTLLIDDQRLLSDVNPSSFLAEFSSKGSLVWVNKGNGGSTGCEISTMAINSNDDIYVGGSFFDSSMSGSFELGDSVYHGTGGFVAKFNASGQTTWSKRISNSMFNYVSDLSIDPQDNVYATGLLSSEIEFGGEQLKGFGGFIAKFSSTGGELKLWTKGNFSYEISNFIATDKAGNIYTTGVFEEAISFGGNTLSVQGGFNDAFIAKLHPGSPVVAEEPGLQAGNLIVRWSNGSSAELEWDNGDGAGRILVVKKLGKVNSGTIADGTVYADGNGTFGSGSNVGARQYVVYMGTDNKTMINGLEPGRVYSVAAFEYDIKESCASSINYNTKKIELAYINTVTSEKPSNSLVVYPNPVEEEMNIIYSSTEKGTRDFVLLDDKGRQLHRFSAYIENDVTTLNFDVSKFNLSRGTYYLKTNDSALQDKVFRILKM